MPSHPSHCKAPKNEHNNLVEDGKVFYRSSSRPCLFLCSVVMLMRPRWWQRINKVPVFNCCSEFPAIFTTGARMLLIFHWKLQCFASIAWPTTPLPSPVWSLPTGPPGPPGGVRVEDIRDTYVTLSWSRGTDNHSPISRYTVQQKILDSIDWKDAKTGQSKHTDTGNLIEQHGQGQRYYVFSLNWNSSIYTITLL